MMVIALVLALLLSSSGASHMVFLDSAKTSIKLDIDDKARQRELLSLLDEAEKTTKEHGKTEAKLIMELSGLEERHDSQTADYQPVLARLRAETEAYEDRMVRYRFAMKRKMTREEWAKVFPVEEQQPAQNLKQGAGQ
jgi:hypothetical protein